MIPDLEDTIVALSSAPGPGGRAIIRMSGPAAWHCAAKLFSPAYGWWGGEVVGSGGPLATDGHHPSTSPPRHLAIPGFPSRPRYCSGHLRLTGLHSLLPADLYFWPAPRTYTGQELVELHTWSSGPLVDLLIGHLLDAGARAAQAGEFTLRAFVAGKLDLTRAEAVLGIIEAGNREELRQALAQLAGGVTRPLEALREDLLNLLADIEAGLDFSDEDIHFVEADEMLNRLTKALARLELLRKQLEQRGTADRPFRVVLVGRPNAGKSSLFNALASEGTASVSEGTQSALVSDQPGTTRDYLVRSLEHDGIRLELVDTAGWQSFASPTPPPFQGHEPVAGEEERLGLRVGAGVRATIDESAVDTIEKQAQILGREQAEHGDLLLLCLEAGQPQHENETHFLTRQGPPAVVGVATKCDLATPPPERLATSAATGAGINCLRTFLFERARSRAAPALAPSHSRCRHHVGSCIDHLRHAHQAVLFDEAAEGLALHLRGALDELGQLVGAVYTDDLLDRIFSRFCIGK
jgi:tRNA modification GTPase